MRFYIKLKKVSLMIILIGFSGFVFADLDSSGGRAPEFTDPSGAAMSFDYTEPGDDQASLGSCAMNPTNGNAANGSIVEDPQMEPEPQPVSFVEDAQPLLRSEMAPRPSPNGTDRNNYPLNPNPPEGPDPPNPLNPTTPEPATLFIIGMSIVGFVPLVKRYRRKQTTL
ncbi:MAG: hypothetical protein LBC02_05110 [Planctomycetaceae bacterium]|jgi:hypothetical protein|nr:hypothetical protein [Planctomycetaceae bacterium]